MKYHSLAASLLVAVFTAAPALASADATIALKTQLIAVLKQLQTLTAEIALLEHTNTSPVAPSVSCPSYSLPTCNGMIVLQGTDASGCQLSQQCPPTTPTISFTASPTGGAGPLAASLSWNTAAVGINDSMDFGDGRHGNWVDAIPSGMNHTYVSPGTYTARLNDISGTTIGSITVAQNAPPCLLYQIPNCTAGQHVQNAPNNSNGCIGAPMCIPDISPTFSASPTSGRAPLGVQFYATIGNQYSIDFGDGQTGSLTSPCNGAANAPKGACPPPGAYHTYAGPGTYSATLRLMTSCPQEASCNLPVGTVTIAVTDGPAPTRN
jgi:PKD repeat protein